ncbi:MAG: type II toxin-antitoxin system VapC family toxin [Polaromonas sp.]
MSGAEYLLDTNFILGMLKSTPEILEVLASKRLRSSQCAFSAITRMELLGFPGIKPEEEALIRDRLGQFVYLAISPAVEDRAIELRRTRRVKLPDAVIAATALCHGLELLTLDSDLQSVLRSTSA